MTFGQLFLILGVIVVVLIIVNIAIAVRVDKRNKHRQQDHEGDQIIDHGGHMFGDGGGYPTASRVTRDPQKYAKAFVPSSAKRKSK